MCKEIEFEGKIIKPSKTGIYKCPFGCGRKDYPAPKWKTESGIIKHLKQCYMRPSAVEARNEAKEDLEQLHQDYADTLDFLTEQILYELPYKIGDEIFYINRIIVKDTHEWRGNRSVKVRYEQVLRFEAVKDVIREINFDKPKQEPTTENAKNIIYFNNGVRINALHNSYQEAIDLAIQKTKADEEGRTFASMCR
jgi:hypothetical protein